MRRIRFLWLAIAVVALGGCAASPPERQADRSRDVTSIVNALEGAGLALFERGERDEARQMLEAAVATDPKRWRAQDRLAVMADLRGNYAEAQQRYTAAIEAQPSSAMLYNNRGYSRYLAGDFAQAGEDFRAAIDRDAGLELAWRNLALVYVRQDRCGQALDAFKRVEGEAAAFNDVGYVLLLLGQYDAAVHFLKQALLKAPAPYPLADHNLERAYALRAAVAVKER